MPGELIAQVDLHAGLAVGLPRAVAAAEDADEVDLGDELGAGLSERERALTTQLVEGLLADPEAGLLRPDLLEFLAGNPALRSPALDPDRAARLLDSIEDGPKPWRPGTPTGIRVFLLDREEILATASVVEIGRAADG